MSLSKEKLLFELEFLRRHYDRLGELMGVKDKGPFPYKDTIKYKHEHIGKVKFIDYLELRIKDGDFD